MFRLQCLDAVPDRCLTLLLLCRPVPCPYLPSPAHHRRLGPVLAIARWARGRLGSRRILNRLVVLVPCGAAWGVCLWSNSRVCQPAECRSLMAGVAVPQPSSSVLIVTPCCTSNRKALSPLPS